MTRQNAWRDTAERDKAQAKSPRILQPFCHYCLCARKMADSRGAGGGKKCSMLERKQTCRNAAERDERIEEKLRQLDYKLSGDV